jgi:phosphatidylinositol glycan class U
MYAFFRVNSADANGLYLPSMFLLSSSWLLPMFHHLWLYSGSGNSNFFYASTLVLNIGQVGWVVDLMRAMVKREGERKSGVLRHLNLETAVL